jgi:hypothetical protein
MPVDNRKKTLEDVVSEIFYEHIKLSLGTLTPWLVDPYTNESSVTESTHAHREQVIRQEVCTVVQCRRTSREETAGKIKSDSPARVTPTFGSSGALFLFQQNSATKKGTAHRYLRRKTKARRNPPQKRIFLRSGSSNRTHSRVN